MQNKLLSVKDVASVIVVVVALAVVVCTRVNLFAHRSFPLFGKLVVYVLWE